MKKLVLLMALLFVASANATDIELLELSMEVAADSSDSSRILIADTTEIFRTGDWAALAFKWEITDDSNFADDSVWFAVQYAQRPDGGWILIPKVVDTVAIGAADTACQKRSIIAVRDSMGLWARVIVSHAVTFDSTMATDLAGNTYKWYVRPWCDKLER